MKLPPLPATSGPPTRAVGSARRTAAIATSCSRKNSSRVPFQYPMFGSFHTSQYHCSTSAFPNRAMLWRTHWKTSSSHFFQSFGG